MQKFLRIGFAVAAILASLFTSSLAHAQERIGVLMLHGKNPGSAHDPNFTLLRPKLEAEGMLVLVPDMPWSRSRYIDGNWDQAMLEIANHVKTLRDQGAKKIVLIGHSMGVPAALSFAARQGDVQAMVLLAPGHAPVLYYTVPSLKAVRDSVDEARKLAAEGKEGAERFNDINQGRPQPVVMTPKNYLSYFDPESDADMSVTAPKVPAKVPSLTVIGDRDPLFKRVKSYYVDKLPPNPKTQYLEVSADHLSTPRVASDALAEWIKKAVAE